MTIENKHFIQELCFIVVFGLFGIIFTCYWVNHPINIEHLKQPSRLSKSINLIK